MIEFKSISAIAIATAIIAYPYSVFPVGLTKRPNHYTNNWNSKIVFNIAFIRLGTFWMRFIITIYFCWAKHAFFEICLFTLHRDDSQAINKINGIRRIYLFFFFRSLSLVTSCCYFFVPGYMTQENNKQFDLLDSKYLALPLFRFIYCGCFFFSCVIYWTLSLWIGFLLVFCFALENLQFANKQWEMLNLQYEQDWLLIPIY